MADGSIDRMSTPGYDDLADLWAVIYDEPHADVEFYTKLAELHSRPSVEYGIGTGRVAASVRPEYGVDVSTQMLKVAASNLGTSVKLICGDLRVAALPDQVMFSYAPFHAFNHFLTEDALIAALLNVRANSRNGGVLVFDMLSPHFYEQVRKLSGALVLSRRTPELTWQTFQSVDWRSGICTMHHVIETLDASGQVVQKRYLQPLYERAYDEATIDALLRKSDWMPISDAEFAHINPFVHNPQKQVWFARAV